MEQGTGQDSIPPFGSVDKSKVLDVKPLRSLVPVFPSSPNFTSFSGPPGSSPFVCVPPSGPFPPGVAPFYPFLATPASQNPQAAFSATPISSAVPINSFRTPEPAETTPRQSRRVANGDTGERTKTRFHKRTRGNQDFDFASPEIDFDLMADNILASHNVTPFNDIQKNDGDKETVEYVHVVFDLLRRKFAQVDDSKEGNPGQARRADLKGGGILMHKGIRTNARKRIGAVPGVKIGDIFFFRMEMCILGLHSPSMAGIDYTSIKIGGEEEPLAISIVSSGGYEDNMDDEDVLIYSGQGGNIYRKDREGEDQQLVRGNLALEKSLHRGNEVRVVRGLKDVGNPAGKVYVYDGLYKIEESWAEKGQTGFNVFKYKLVRIAGQSEAFKTWKSIQLWRDGVVPRSGVILPDLTSGAENLPVSLVNDLDDEKGPAYFTYSPSLHYSKPVNSTQPFVGCACTGGCLPGKQDCSCIQKNGPHLPYIANGVLVDHSSMIYECGSFCHCLPNCRNRVSQGGIRIRLEVFKTKDKGWGLRSWDPIRAGTFICEYAGEAINDPKLWELVGDNEDDHVFDGTHIYRPLEVLLGNSGHVPNLPFPLIIDARKCGNVARFMNHSCSPNVFWLPVLRSHSKEFDLHILFHAIRHIPPMVELTYNYGMVPPDRSDQRRKRCLCRSPKCKGFFY
uniref:Uncharacterized protein n=1 Tax=Rhizophora mucronata TaxID=61149 RepID=A0A2P2NY25_RHIMU